jgi:hypothetical protein
MVKLRRFRVVPSSDAAERDFESACVDRLEASGCARANDGEPADFVLCFSRRFTTVTTPPFGIWSFDVDGGPPPGWRAMVAGRHSVAARLSAELADGRRVVLSEGALPVSLVYRRTRDQLNHTLSQWPARAVAEIEGCDASSTDRFARLAEHCFRVETPSVRRSPADFTLRAGPSRRERLHWMCVQPWRRLRHWWREMARYDTWNVGMATLERPLRDVHDLQALGEMTWLPPQRPLHFVADPFPYRHDGRDWLLVEEYGHPQGVRGRISRVDVAHGAMTIQPAIVRNSHLSYPFTFEDAGHMYCAPEMGQEDGCIIYRLGDDGRWTAVHHILCGHRVIDPTFVFSDERWWVFCTDERSAGSLALHAFYATALGGPWAAHRLNPLKCDLASARPAGRPFTLDGRLFRPAQDCSRTYGGAVNVMEVAELSPTRFRETLALRLEPDRKGPYPHGLHHLVVDGTRVYVDAKRRRYDYLLWLKTWLHRS